MTPPSYMKLLASKLIAQVLLNVVPTLNSLESDLKPLAPLSSIVVTKTADSDNDLKV